MKKPLEGEPGPGLQAHFQIKRQTSANIAFPSGTLKTPNSNNTSTSFPAVDLNFQKHWHISQYCTDENRATYVHLTSPHQVLAN